MPVNGLILCYEVAPSLLTKILDNEHVGEKDDCHYEEYTHYIPGVILCNLRKM